MTFPQLFVFGVLAATLALFVWNRWRHDVVALLALLAVTVAGLVPAGEAFLGFGHPAVVTVAAVLVLSRGLFNAGVVDTIARQLTRAGARPTVQVAMLTGIVALTSGFMNNVGALTLLMPVAVWMARQKAQSPSPLLMPLAFASLLGGTMTLIGTPPNIIIATFRAQSGAPPFAMFDFLPAGAGITLVGVLFIILAGWRLTPQRRVPGDGEEWFRISEYITEVRVPEESAFAGRTLHDLLAAVEEEAEIVAMGVVRGERRMELPSTYEVLRPGDILVIEADSDSLKALLDLTGLTLAEAPEANAARFSTREMTMAEVVVAPRSPMLGRSPIGLNLRERYGINVLAVARLGQRLRERLRRVRFVAGDVLLVQASAETLQAALPELGCLPLAERGLRIGRPRKVVLATVIFSVAIMAAASGLLAPAPALVCGALAMLGAGLLSPSEAYDAIDWPVVVLLAALLPVSGALERTGGAQLIATGLLEITRTASPAVMLAILLGATMLLSNVVNNAAAAMLVAPIALQLAAALQASADPLLMAVAVGASCTFLTPIGHQSNALVMAPGGYRFGDYWRMGAPLSLLVVATAVPILLWVWPL